MKTELLAQADALPGTFYVPGAESLPGWVVGIGALFYVLILAYNAATNFSAGRKQAHAQTERAGAKSPAGIPNDLIVTGAALADRQSMSLLSENLENLSETIQDCFGERGALVRTFETFTGQLSRLASAYEKRVEIEERDARESEIRRRVDEELRRKNGSV